MDSSYGAVEFSLMAYLKRFSDENRREARFRLSSIGGLALDAGFKPEHAVEHIRIISGMVRRYRPSEQIDALKILERRYAEASMDRRSRLLEYLRPEQLPSNWQDPVKRLFEKFQAAYMDCGILLTLNGLDRAAEDTFGAASYVEPCQILSNRNKKGGRVTVL